VGRQTFEDFRNYWPKQTADPTGVTDHLNRVAKYVVSSTMSDPRWENSIVLTGSISPAHALIADGVVGYHAAALRRMNADRPGFAQGWTWEHRTYVDPTNCPPAVVGGLHWPRHRCAA
jgi:hypothetical protein